MFAAPSAQATAAALTSEISDEELRSLFAEASVGGDTVTFDQATRLEGVDGILEEGATSLKELLIYWGDDSVALDFEGFKKWYLQVLRIYDEFLWKDAVAPPSDLLADLQEDEEEEREYTDDELLEDAPTQNQSISELVQRREEAALQAPGLAPPADVAPAVRAAPARANTEVTRLFREGCDEENLLSFEALLEISEFSDIINQGDMTVEELEGLWAELSKSRDRIDVLTFKTLLQRVDDLFEFEEEQPDEEVPKEVTKVKRDPLVVKSELETLIASLEEVESRPCGLDGREETDANVVKLTTEMEKLWREKIGDVEDFNEAEIVGEWELVYSTSAKYRRWQSILNTDKFVKGGQLDGLVQAFKVEPSTLTNEYEMEEIFLLGEQELGMRALGSWCVALQDNVVSGEEDLVLKLNLNSVEYDTEEGEAEQAEKKLLTSQMVRTFCYSFISYLDEDIRIMRTGLTGNSVFIYQRMQATSKA